jgi:hypothetical protein
MKDHIRKIDFGLVVIAVSVAIASWGAARLGSIGRHEVNRADIKAIHQSIGSYNAEILQRLNKLEGRE